MRVFVTGAAGQLGHDVLLELKKRGHAGIGSDISTTCEWLTDDPEILTRYVQLDITSQQDVLKAITEIRPDAVVHCAAWTNVDMAEDAANKSNVRSVNVDGTRNIAEACKALDCKMVYVSTDYVFSGQGVAPWEPDCKDYKPQNVYGQTKLEGELVVSGALQKFFIVRTAWLFGTNGKNFITTMLKLSQHHDTIRVVNDQIGTPTYARDLARLLVDMIGTEQYGYYHATNEDGYISWYDFACEIFRQASCTTAVIPVTTVEYGLSAAARPYNSRLETKKLVEKGFAPLPAWRNALCRYLRTLEIQTDDACT